MVSACYTDRMRILMSSTAYPPKLSGVAVFSQSLAQFAAAHGHQVVVVTSAPRRATASSLAEPIDGVRVIELPSMANPFHRELTLPLPSRRRLASIVAEFRPDVVHLQDPLPASQTIAAIAAQRRIPVIATHHFSFELVAAYVPGWFRPILKVGLGWWLRRSYRHCALVTAPSQRTVADLAAFGVSAPLAVLSNGVALERFAQSVSTWDVQRRFNLPTTEPLLLFVGRLDPDKSVDVLLRAVAIARATRPVHLVLVGDGDARSALEALTHSLGISDPVTFTGRIDHADDTLVALYQRADLFVIASTIETQGIVVIEALAAGLPVVAANANALPELITAETGRLVPAGDAAGFAASILELIADPAQRRTMSTAAKAAAAPHALDRCLARFLAEYQRLVRR